MDVARLDTINQELLQNKSKEIIDIRRRLLKYLRDRHAKNRLYQQIQREKQKLGRTFSKYKADEVMESEFVEKG